jgi:hypothetical protein
VKNVTIFGDKKMDSLQMSEDGLNDEKNINSLQWLCVITDKITGKIQKLPKVHLNLVLNFFEFLKKVPSALNRCDIIIHENAMLFKNFLFLFSG